MTNESARRSSAGRPLRGAIVGFGNVALHAHLPAWRGDARFRIEAIVESVPDRADMARQALPEARVYAELGPLLADGPLDFLDICTPPGLHADQIFAACRSGLHVFCEKPMVTTLEDLARVRWAAAESGSVVYTVNNWKHSPIWAKALELVRQGAIGSVRSAELTVLRPPQSGGGATPWRRSSRVAGGGILLDHGWHHVYLLLSLLGEVPAALSARVEHSHPEDPDLEETAELDLSFREAKARIHLTWRASSRSNYGVITGSRGRLRLNDDHIVVHSEDNGACSSLRFDFPQALSSGSHHAGWMTPVLEDFWAEIEDPGLRGKNLEEASWCARLIALAYRSAREGSRVIRVSE